MTPQATRPPRRPRTDPAERPRARKAAAAEQSGRPAVRPTSRQIRRRRIAALVIAVVVLAGLAVGARAAVYDSGWFDVKDVKVTGVTTLAMADVLGAADVTPGRPLAEVDTRGIASRVAALSGVASVEVSRSWPHTVAVDVVERVPVAVASTPSGDQLVDTGGVVYAGKVVPNLPRMAFGPVGPTDAPTRAALAAFAQLPAAVRAQVLTIDSRASAENAPSQVSFGLTGDRQVRWGASERGQEKAAVLVPLLTQPGRVYDVTSPDLATIRR